MDIVISGYGPDTERTIQRYTYEEEQLILTWEAAVFNASFVCMGDGHLFTTTETPDYVKVYSFRNDDKGFHLVDQKQLEGGSLCHITYSAKNKALFGACYDSGTIISIQVEKGMFGELLHHEIQYGADPSALTRAHCVLLNRAETELITVNIALDQICFYDVKEGKVSLTRVLELPKGVGPRHAILSAQEDYLYIITEYSNGIFIYENQPEKRLLQRVSTLAEDFTGINYCSTLCFSRDNHYLYAANRGADTIVLFQVDEKGQLNRLQEFPCGGSYPRHMIVTMNGKYLVICNQNSDNVVAFRLDESTGFLLDKTMDLPFKIPSGILEIGE